MKWGDRMPSVLWMLSFFSSFSLSVISVLSSGYLRLLIFLPAILIPAYASSSPVFLMMYSAYRLSRVTIYSLDVLLFLFGTSLLFHVHFARGQGRQPRGATPRQRSGGCAGPAGPRGATPRSRSGGAALRRYPSSKVRSSRCALLEQPWRDTPRLG